MQNGVSFPSHFAARCIFTRLYQNGQTALMYALKDCRSWRNYFTEIVLALLADPTLEVDLKDKVSNTTATLLLSQC